MRRGAHIQTVIEILDDYQVNRGPFDQHISAYLRARRYMGSSDRRFIQDTCFAVLRHYFMLNFGLSDNDPKKHYFMVLRYFYHCLNYTIDALNLWAQECPSNYGFASISINDAAVITLESCAAALSGLPPLIEHQFINNYTLQERRHFCDPAPFDCRVNQSKISRDVLIQQLNADAKICDATPHSPVGIRFTSRLKMAPSPYFSVQDEGSQLLCWGINPQPGEKILDYCAGAGGKSLALADLSGDQAIIHATDIDGKKLQELHKRAQLAQFKSIQIFDKHHIDGGNDLYDKILIDVPCSGTGILRRSPERKLWLTQHHIDNFVTVQQQILDQVVNKLKPGGLLYYFTCSLLPCENDEQIKKFLNLYPQFAVINFEQQFQNLPHIRYDKSDYGITLTPCQTGTDGFYGAVLQCTT